MMISYSLPYPVVLIINKCAILMMTFGHFTLLIRRIWCFTQKNDHVMKICWFCCIRLVTFISCYESRELVIDHFAKIQYIFQKRFPWQPKSKRMKFWDASHLNFQYHGSTNLSTKYNVFIIKFTLLVKWFHNLCLILLCSLWTNALFWWWLLVSRQPLLGTCCHGNYRLHTIWKLISWAFFWYITIIPDCFI